ncbi:MAG: polyhydroxyalkanoate synthesis repressor PhaR [Rhodospirillales bacterium]|nr:polyhydroxyalkanoate synthesis repressor PhaR [Rhodospirillales bacterium]MCB9973688.1 polyhydroxyalkanoate synthesis repressor PhaR [Rhodospirillales bacterium]
MGRTRPKPGEPVIVKKYANRRLYDTGRSAYVTLEDLNDMVKEDIDFIVLDAKTGEDLTRSVLTQIVAEQETKGENLLPTAFLRKLIGLYGENMHGVVPEYLEQTMQFLIDNQKQMLDRFDEQLQVQQERMKKMGEMFPHTSSLEEIGRRNMELFQSAIKNLVTFPEDDKK